MGGVPNSTGLADTSNPMLHGLNTRKRESIAPAASTSTSAIGAAKMNEKSRSSLFSNENKSVVLVKGIFLINPKLNFMPDWM